MDPALQRHLHGITALLAVIAASQVYLVGTSFAGVVTGTGILVAVPVFAAIILLLVGVAVRHWTSASAVAD